ncbi:hypothetical protein MSIM_48440 [Mycobacterium simiae]|nr:hypothetical protein MSIM_48440 [Mycobacterium simiae]
MTSGYGGWGWCSAIITAPATLLLWGGVVIAIILVVRSAVRRPSEPPAPSPYGRRDGVVAAPVRRSEPDSDEFYRRLM